jgi:hypothetical protein
MSLVGELLAVRSMVDANANNDRDVLATITAVRDLCARAGQAQIVATLHMAMFEIQLLRQQLHDSHARHRLLEQMALGGRGGGKR